jgi:hypothetical protein
MVESYFVYLFDEVGELEGEVERGKGNRGFGWLGLEGHDGEVQ